MEEFTSACLPFSSPSTQCCCMKNHEQYKSGTPASDSEVSSCGGRVSLVLPFCPPGPGFLSGTPVWHEARETSADPGGWGWQDQSCAGQLFSAFVCVILSQTHFCFILQLLFSFCRRRGGGYLKGTLDFVQLGFSGSEIVEFHFIHSLQLPSTPRQFLTAKLVLYPVSLYKHLAFLLAGEYKEML